MSDAFDAGVEHGMRKAAGFTGDVTRFVNRNPEVAGAVVGAGFGAIASPSDDRWRYVPTGAGIGALIANYRYRPKMKPRAGLGGPSAPVGVPAQAVT